MRDRAHVIIEARLWKGTKWQHQGRTRAGVDCAGLIVVVAQALGIPVEDRTDYQRRTHGAKFLQHFKDNLTEKPLPEMKEGDIIVLTEPAYPCHCGIVTRKNGELYFIHSYARRRRVVEEHLSQAWRDKIVGVFEFPGVVD